MCDLDTVDLIRAYFIFLTLVHVFCCLSHVKCYSWVHTIILCILVTILGWPRILTQYMLPRTESYLFSSLFSFYEMQRVYLWLLISLSSSQPPAYQVTGWAIHSSSCWIFRSWHDVLYFRTHTILFFILVYSIFLDLVLEIRCPWCDEYQILGW